MTEMEALRWEVVNRPPPRPKAYVEELSLTCRCYNALKNSGIDDTEQLRRALRNPLDLLRISNFGSVSLRETRLAFEAFDRYDGTPILGQGGTP